MAKYLQASRERNTYRYHDTRKIQRVHIAPCVSAARILASLHERIDIERTISQIITSWPRLDRKRDGSRVKSCNDGSRPPSIPFLIFPCRSHAAWRGREKKGGERKKKEKRKRRVGSEKKGRTPQPPARVRVAEFKRLLKPLPCIRIIVALVSRHERSYRYLATIKPCAYTRSRDVVALFFDSCVQMARVSWDRSQFPFPCKETVCYYSFSLFVRD